MGPIQSILVYNGGSAGDFLKSVCIEQLGQGSIHTLTDKGMTEFNHHYFKFLTAQWFEDNYQRPLEVNDSKIYKVENTHYYHSSYKQITNNIYYIDYPNELQPLVLKSYVKKRWDNDYQKLFQQHFVSLPKNLRKFVQTENIEKVLNVLWIKNLKIWRSEPGLKRINFQDLLDYKSLKFVVEEIIQQPLLDPDQLQISQQRWVSKNQDLVNFFRTPSDII